MNIVYKTYEIATDKEYSAGTRLNLSGVRVVKLVNRPAGVQVWISTDSNKTNLFPLVNRGDGWILPNSFDPIFDLYVYTEGINSQDKLIISYTGEDDFFHFGSSSIERVDEIENFGELAKLPKVGEIESFNSNAKLPKVGEIENLSKLTQFAINDSVNNMYVKKPVNNDIVYIHRFYSNIQLDYNGNLFDADPSGHGANLRCISFIGNTTADLNVRRDSFYRLSIVGHVDIGSQYEIQNDSGDEWTIITNHLTLFSNDKHATFMHKEQLQLGNKDIIEAPNFFKMNKKPYGAISAFDLFGIKYERTGNNAYFNGNNNINLDFVLRGQDIYAYDYLGYISHIYIGKGKAENYSYHCNLILTLSKLEATEGISYRPFPDYIWIPPMLELQVKNQDRPNGVYYFNVTYGQTIEIIVENLVNNATLNIKVPNTGKGNAYLKDGTRNIVIYRPFINQTTLAYIELTQTYDNQTSNPLLIEIRITRYE